MPLVFDLLKSPQREWLCKVVCGMKRLLHPIFSDRIVLPDGLEKHSPVGSPDAARKRRQ